MPGNRSRNAANRLAQMSIEANIARVSAQGWTASMMVFYSLATARDAGRHLLELGFCSEA
jgi:hypothetical protein